MDCDPVRCTHWIFDVGCEGQKRVEKGTWTLSQHPSIDRNLAQLPSLKPTNRT